MANTKERTAIKVQAERAILAAVRLPSSRYDLRDPFGELRALAEQAGAVVVGEMEQRLQAPVAATFMGKGKVQELKGACEALDASLVIFDHELSPRQIAKIEEVIERKVIDRSELILDIFAGRATTHEAQLQVELAQMEYTFPRLRAMWDHLERIVGHGGIGGIGTRGPGEQQLEIDRRLVQRKKLDLQRELKGIHGRKRRMVAERKLGHFTVCLVGYTNAGKSTIFNTLTEGGAYADDRLFATLVTRTREWDLAGGLTVMLSDTVGFVRDLPTHLIASFRATLEEATQADLLLVVLDVADPAVDMHLETVSRTLDELIEARRVEEEREGADEAAWRPPERLILLNKADRLRDNREVVVWAQKFPEAIPFSGIEPWPTGRGHEALRQVVLAAAQGGVEEVRITAPMSEGKVIQRIENRGQVLEREYVDGQVTLRVRIGRRQLDQLRSSAGGKLRVESVAVRRPSAEDGGSTAPRKRKVEKAARRADT